MTLTFVLPMPPNLANARMHWRRKHREKLDYWMILDAKLAWKDLPNPPRRPWPHATIRSTMYLGASMDDDNAMARHKWALDWLVSRGYLVDDRKRCLTWDGFPAQVVKRDGNYRLEITIAA